VAPLYGREGLDRGSRTQLLCAVITVLQAVLFFGSRQMQELINRLDLSVNQLASVGNSEGRLAGATYKPNCAAAHPAGRVRCAFGPSERWQGVGRTIDFLKCGVYVTYLLFCRLYCLERNIHIFYYVAVVSRFLKS
jgi:hypothetical protein